MNATKVPFFFFFFKVNIEAKWEHVCSCQELINQATPEPVLAEDGGKENRNKKIIHV